MKTIKVPKARQLPSGSWMCRCMVNGESVCVTRSTKKAAEEEALHIKLGILQISKATDSGKTVADAIDAYIAARKTSLSPSTVRGYAGMKRQRFQSIMYRPLRTLTQNDFQRAVDLEAKCCAPKTIKNAWGFLSSVLKEATGKDYKIHLPAAVPSEHEFLQPEQIETFLSAIRDTDIEIPALLALHGLRRSEIIGMKWSAVDLKKGLLNIQGAVVFNEEGKLEAKPTNKNRTSRRTVPIMIPRLRELLEADPKTTEYVVTCHPSTIYNNVNRICEKNGLPKIGTHGLRHSFCSLAYHLNIPEKVVMQIGGWSDFQTMRKIYTHLAKSDLSDAVTAVTEFFQSKAQQE